MEEVRASLLAFCCLHPLGKMWASPHPLTNENEPLTSGYLDSAKGHQFTSGPRMVGCRHFPWLHATVTQDRGDKFFTFKSPPVSWKQKSMTKCQLLSSALEEVKQANFRAGEVLLGDERKSLKGEE